MKKTSLSFILYVNHKVKYHKKIKIHKLVNEVD